MASEPELSAPQRELMEDETSPELLFLGGVNSGKTMLGAFWIVDRMMLQPAHVGGMIVAHVWHMFDSTILPALERACELLGIALEIVRSAKLAFIGVERRQVLLRSGDIPDNLAGPTLGVIWQDEPALQPPRAYERISQRCRHPDAVLRQVLFTGTPEGTRTWLAKREKSPSVHTVRASSFSNPWRPLDFDARLRDTYAGDPAQWRNYVEGIATDAIGNIYTAFSQDNVVECKNVRDGQTVVLWDFNVHCLVTLLGVFNSKRNQLHIWGEVVSPPGVEMQTDVHAETVVKVLLSRHETLYQHKGQLIDGMRQSVIACCDASGSAPSTVSRNSNHIHVMNAGFELRHGKANPLTRDRIAAVQLAFRRKQLLIDPSVKRLIQAVKEHSRDKYGEPMKWHGPQRADDLQLDHWCDSLGYGVWIMMPVSSEKHNERQRNA